MFEILFFHASFHTKTKYNVAPQPLPSSIPPFAAAAIFQGYGFPFFFSPFNLAHITFQSNKGVRKENPLSSLSNCFLPTRSHPPLQRHGKCRRAWTCLTCSRNSCGRIVHGKSQASRPSPQWECIRQDHAQRDLCQTQSHLLSQRRERKKEISSESSFSTRFQSAVNLRQGFKRKNHDPHLRCSEAFFFQHFSSCAILSSPTGNRSG